MDYIWVNEKYIVPLANMTKWKFHNIEVDIESIQGHCIFEELCDKFA
jgi:hypothetical protein